MLPDYRTYQGTTKLIPKDQLYHYGILDMHWGIRRFQPYPKGYHGDGKYVGETKRVKQRPLSRKERKLNRQIEQERVESERRLKQLEDDIRRKKETDPYYEEKKQRALKYGSATEILQFKGDLTHKELDEVIKRLDLEAKISEVSKKEKEKMINDVDTIIGYVGKFNTWTQTGLATASNMQNLKKFLDGEPIQVNNPNSGGKKKKK